MLRDFDYHMYCKTFAGLPSKRQDNKNFLISYKGLVNFKIFGDLNFSLVTSDPQSFSYFWLF